MPIVTAFAALVVAVAVAVLWFFAGAGIDWVGDQVSPDTAHKKLASIDRLARNRVVAGPFDVGIPVIRGG